MRKWCVKIFVSVIFLSLSFADIERHDITELKKCEGETVNFSDPFELKKYILVELTFSPLSTQHNTTILAESKNIEKGPIKYLADGYEGRLKVFPESTIKFSLSQISRKDNGSYTFIIFHGNGDQDIFKWNLQVEGVTDITKPSVTTNIVSGTECTKYVCSTEQKDVHRSWIYQGDKQINGSTLMLCNNNRSQAVSCIVRAACSSNYTTVIEGVDDDDSSSGCYIYIGIGIGSGLIICILFVILIVLMRRSGNKYLYAKKRKQIFQHREPTTETTKPLNGEANV